MELDQEMRSALLELYQEAGSPVQKRLAAYLVLMKKPDRTVLRDVLSSLTSEKEEQVKNFVISHLNNLQTSEEPLAPELREDIGNALRDDLEPSDVLHHGLSRNYRLESPLGSLKGNVLLDGKDTLPQEVALEARLKALDQNYDLFGVGLDGTGFEPTIGGLFGEKGFLEESISRLVFLAGDKAPILRGVLDQIIPRRDRGKRQASEDHLKAIGRSFQKLLSGIRSSSPEVTAYLRLLGQEMGHLKTSEIRETLQTLLTYSRMLPAQALSKLTSSTENQLFLHYIFMESSFSLPTAAGFPLKLSLSGVFAPGVKGGLKPSGTQTQTQVSLAPSVGLGFITRMGVHIPDYVDAGMEMHTDLFHQSELSAALELSPRRLRLSLPAPQAGSQLLGISNRLLSISAGQTKLVPPQVEGRVDSTHCQPLVSGLDLCTVRRYSNATANEQAPHFPLSGETRFAVEIQPTGKVSAYTATLTDESPREPSGGRQRPEALKLVLRAEGEDPLEASASLRYDRQQEAVSLDLRVPDLDLEAGVRLALTDGDPRGGEMRGVSIDVTNKNVPQLHLVGRARLESMREAMLQLQVDVPALKADASITALLKRDQRLVLDLETLVHLDSETPYQQKASLRYDEDKVELELKTDANSEIQRVLPSAGEHHRRLQQLLDDLLDQQVAQTDMKLRHIVTKGIQAGNIWMDKLTARFPSLETLRSRRSLSDLTLPALPDKLFLQSDLFFRYQFNKDKMAVSLPLPFGGKTSEELNFPRTVWVPRMGGYLPAGSFHLPSFSVPPSLEFALPLLGLAKASARVHSNFYTWEASVSGGNSTLDAPSYAAQYKVEAQCPIGLLSYKLEGVGMVSGGPDGSLKYLLNSSFSHVLLDTSASVLETVRVLDRDRVQVQVLDGVQARATYRLEASSPLGLEAWALYSAQASSSPDSGEVSGDGSAEGRLRVGGFRGNGSYAHSYRLRPRDGEGRGDATLSLLLPGVRIQNAVRGSYADSQLAVLSQTAAGGGAFKHEAEVKYKDGQLSLRNNMAAAGEEGRGLSSKLELGLLNNMAVFSLETQADDGENKAFSLVTGSLDSQGAELTSEASVLLEAGRAMHKASARVGRGGVAFSGTNAVRCSPVTLEHAFGGALDGAGARLTSDAKATAPEGRGELRLEAGVKPWEATLSGVLNGFFQDAATENSLKADLNGKGVALTGNTKAELGGRRSESSHALNMTLWTLRLRSKSDGVLAEDVSYRHDCAVDLKPFVASLDSTGGLRVGGLSLSGEGRARLAPTELGLSGSLRGAHGDDGELEGACRLALGGAAGSASCNSTGRLGDARLSHRCLLEFAGLSSKSDCEARVDSEPLRFQAAVRTLAKPFSLVVDAVVDGDGEMNLQGTHAGKLSGKLAVKAEPLALGCSHENSLSTTHKLAGGESSTSLESRFESLLSPTGQSLDWKLNSRLNRHAYEQRLSARNDPERAGVEFRGQLLTDLFSRQVKRAAPELQEFSSSGFLKYDKSGECHVVQLPFVESLPAAFRLLQDSAVRALESLQEFVRSLDVVRLIGDFRSSVGRVPGRVKEFMQEMDLENKVNQVKDKLDYAISKFAITMDDLELTVDNLRQNLERTIIDLATKVQDMVSVVEDYIKEGRLSDKVTSVLLHIRDQLSAFDEKYKVRQLLVQVVAFIEDIVRQIDPQKLKESSVAFLQDFDSKYGVLQTAKEKLSDLKLSVQTFDLDRFLEDVKSYVLSFDWASYVERFLYQIPASDIAKVLESMKDVVVNWIDEYEIPNKLNAVYSYFKNLVLKYDLDDIFKDLMDQAVVLVKRFKIEETVQEVVETLKSIKFELAYDKIMDFLYSVTSQIRAIDFKKSIDDLNESISSAVTFLREFDYDSFVTETNVKIEELTQYLNEEIEKYEIVKKIEAVRGFFREIQNSIYAYLNELKNTKVADSLKKLKDVIDTAFYNDVKLKVQDILEDMKQRILNMDIRDEIYIYLNRVSESYSNIVAFISAQFNRLMENLEQVANGSPIPGQVKEAVGGVLDQIRRAEIEVPTFTVPFTDLVVPTFTISLSRLQEISIPAQISVPEFTILNSYTIPALTIDFDEIKARIVAIIDSVREFEIQTPDPEEVFGDLKVLYLFELPDLTLKEITLSEIKFPAVSIPKLNMEDFVIAMVSIPDVKFPEVPSDVCITVFGKLHGEFTITSPYYTVVTSGKIENSTSSLKNPQFTATITSKAESPVEPLEYTFEATAQLEAPRMKKLQFKETVKASHMAFFVDHEGSLTLTGSSAEASAKTTTKATTQMYTADLVNKAVLSLSNGIYTTIDTTYNHNLDVPSIETSSQASIEHNGAAQMESGIITATSKTTGNGKWSIRDYSDEGTHQSEAKFSLDFSTVKLTFTGETDSKALKAKQTLTAESLIMSHITVEARCETEAPSVKKSVTVLNGEVNMGDLKAALTASHEAEFTGDLTGSMSNSLDFMAYPFELSLDVKNRLNSKMFLPLKLTGRVDVQHDYGFVLNSEKQRATWIALARFNQYKYGHNLAAENNEMDINFHSSVNGEANLDFLTVPLSIPEMTVPYLETKTPELRDFSLWENAGFKSLLVTPQQSFDMNLKLQYKKSPNVHSFELHLEPIYNAFSDNAKVIQTQFEAYRDKIVTVLKDSYNEAKSQYIKHKIDTSSQPPRIFRVPGYTIPVLNIRVSSFSAEMPAFTYFVPKEVSTPSFKIPALRFSVPSYILVLPSLRLPVIHVPETLSDMKLPAFTLPTVQDSIVIPAMGNLTCDFSFKSTVVTLNANAGLYNESDIIARFGASSVSVFDVLNGKIDGTTSLTRTRGLKMATSVSLESSSIQADHECSLSLSKRSLEALVANNMKIDLPFLKLEITQTLTGNTKSKPNVLYKKALKYMFNIPLIESVGKGNFDMNWELEALSTQVSLETSTKGKSDIMVMDSKNIVGDFENKATFFVSPNALRSMATTALKLNVDQAQKQKRSVSNSLVQFDLTNNVGVEVFLRRVFATFDYTSNNNVDLESFNTNGKHLFKGEVEFEPLSTFRVMMATDARQGVGSGEAGIVHTANLVLSSEKQSLSWSGREELSSFAHAYDLSLSNDEAEVRWDASGSVEGRLAFLKSVKIPVYQRTLWDVLKFDEFTSAGNSQFFNVSSNVVYTKSSDGFTYAIPSKLFENGVTFSIPEVTVALPRWVREIPRSLKRIDPRFENVEVPESLVLPPAFSVPAFDVPFTNLHVEPFTVDPKTIDVPQTLTTKAFDITLPGLPAISIPSYDINTEYLQGRMPLLSFRFPQYDVTVSSFPLPTFGLSQIANQISNVELPDVVAVVPEQKIEIPEVSLNLPSSVFIPAFGALSATLKVSSPIYNVSTTASVEKKDPDLVASLGSLCTSTMIFLEYNLTASAVVRVNDGRINLNGMCTLVHSDVNVKWQHVLARSLRAKRQTPRGDGATQESRHTLSVDVSSRTFADVVVRFTSRRDGLTASVSSPAAGFLGLHLQRRSPSQVVGKLFARYLSTPEKDTSVLSLRASLRNSEKLVLQTSWNGAFFQDAFEGAKERVPAATGAVLGFLNKYHAAHFGFDLNRAAMKLKTAASNAVEKAYQQPPLTLAALRGALDRLVGAVRRMYRDAADGLAKLRPRDAADRLAANMDAARTFMDEKFSITDLDGKFSIPGLDWKFSLEDLRLEEVMEKFSVPGLDWKFSVPVLDRKFSLEDLVRESGQWLDGVLTGVLASVPGTELHLEEITEKLRSSFGSAHHSLRASANQVVDWVLKKLVDVLQLAAGHAEGLLAVVRERERELSTRVDAAYADAVRWSGRRADEAQSLASRGKDLLKVWIQEAYGAAGVEQANGAARGLLGALQANLSAALGEGLDLARAASQSTAPYLRVGGDKMEVEVPLPFVWRSFGEWPNQIRL